MNSVRMGDYRFLSSTFTAWGKEELVAKVVLSGYPEIILQSQSESVTGRAKLLTQASRDKSLTTAFDTNLKGRRECLKRITLALLQPSKTHLPSLQLCTLCIDWCVFM